MDRPWIACILLWISLRTCSLENHNVLMDSTGNETAPMMPSTALTVMSGPLVGVEAVKLRQDSWPTRLTGELTDGSVEQAHAGNHRHQFTGWERRGNGVAAVQQQRFRMRPANISVVEGDDATLHCEVDYQAGMLQWAREGFALGYKRHLPGYPRYRLLGDAASGVHNLEIRNASLKDDGRFQCQVSPNRGQQYIKADAYLTVLVKPTYVRVTSSSNPIARGVYEMNDGSQLNLRCDVSGAKPLAEIQWHRNGVDITPDKGFSVSGPGHNVTKQTSTSLIALPLNRGDDGAEYSCIVRHPAIRHEEQGKYRATVSVSVLYPPGAPEIVGTDAEEEPVKAGERTTLTCRSRGGNPPAELVWFRDQQVLPHRYSTSREGAEARVFFTASAEDMKAVYRCQASSAVQPQPTETTYRPNVLFGPDSVGINGTEVARGGEEILMRCRTSRSNPASNITWEVNGRTMTGTTQVVDGTQLEGYISSSDISVAVPQGMQEDMTVSCNGVNSQMGITQRASVNVVILRPASLPYIIGYDTTSPLAAGEVLSLTCAAHGGNPPANLTWWSEQTPLASDPPTMDGDIAQSVLVVHVSAEDNHRTYRCISNSPALEEPQRAAVTLTVAYPPSSLLVSVAPEALEAGTEAILTCESSAANPATNLTWLKQGKVLKYGVEAQQNMDNGTSGGVSSRLVLKTNVTWVDHGENYTCRASSEHFRAAVRQQVTLSVTHAPVFEKEIYELDIRSGESRDVNISIRANPSFNLTYSVFRKSGEELVGPKDRVTFSGGVFRVRNITRGDMGWYTINSSNVRGLGVAHLHINVQYGPDMVSVSRLSLVSTGDDAILECTAQANPMVDQMISWRRSGFAFGNGKTKEYYRNGTSYLTVYRVSAEDIGYFRCVVDNGVGRATAETGLVVKHAPWIEASTSGELNKAAAKKGGIARIVCEAEGAPNVTFSWSKADRQVQISSAGGKYSERYIQTGLVGWRSSLIVTGVDSSDYGQYRCTASNPLGTAEALFLLTDTTAPEPPRHLRASNATHNSVTLQWTPAFNGGLSQKFRIRYASSSGSNEFVDGLLGNSTSAVVAMLRQDTQYSFWISAFNRLGHSPFSSPAIVVRTSGTPPVGYITDRDDHPVVTMSHLIIIIVAVSGSLLLAVNVIIVTCYVRRRRRRKANAGVDGDEGKSQQMRMFGNGNGNSSSMSVKTSESYLREDSVDDIQDSTAGRHQYEQCPLRQQLSPTTMSFATNHIRHTPCELRNFQSTLPRRHSHGHLSDECSGRTYGVVESYPAPLSPPRAPQFGRQPLSPPDLLHSNSTDLPQDLLSRLRNPMMRDNRMFASLPRTKGLSSFGRVISPPPCIPELETEFRGDLV